MEIRLLPSTARATLTSSETVVGQFMRYLVVGGIAFVVDFGVLLLLTELFDLHYLASAAAGFCCGLVTIYILSITWVFNIRSLESKRVEFVIFVIIGVAGLGWTVLLLYLFTDLAACRV